MTKQRRYIFFVLLLTVGLFSCKSNKEVVVQSGNNFYNPKLSSKENYHLQSAFMMGIKEKLIGNSQMAEGYFNECLKVDSKHAASYYELALILESRKMTNQALGLALNAYSLDKQNEWYGLLCAKLLQQRGDHNNAAKIYEDLAEKHPANVEYLYEWANALIYQNKLKESIKIFDLIEQKLGVSEEISLQKERIYMEMKDLDGAISELNKLLEKEPKSAKYHGILAELLLKKGKKEEALKEYDLVLELDPENPYIYLSLYEYYTVEGNEAKAAEMLKKAFSNNKLGIDIKVQQILSYFTYEGLKPGKKDEAMALGQALVEAHPTDPKSHSVYGDLLFRDNQPEKAREHYRKAAELDPSKFVIWNQILIIDSELNDFTSMYEESKRAMELFPSQPLFYLFQGISANQKKKYDEAVKALSGGVEYVFDNPPLKSQFYASLGDAYYKLEDYPKSDTSFENALKIEPDNIYVLNNYSYYLSLRKHNLERAAEMSKKTIEKEPNSPSYLDTYGWILFQQGKYEEAKTHIEKAIEKGAVNNAVILEHLGDVYFMLNQPEKAYEYWVKAQSGEGDKSKELQYKVTNKRLP